MACNDKVSLTCGKLQLAVCVKYDANPPEFSELTECANIKETISELYTLVGEIREGADMVDLPSSCITYPTGDLTVRDVIIAQQEKICEQEASIQAMQALITTIQQQIADLETNCN